MAALTEKASAVKSKGEWFCEKCTFRNEGDAMACGMCYHPRFEIKDMPVQWQWQAADRWITYDIEATMEIEDAYKAKQKSVALTKGAFFVENPGYEITFSSMTQTCSHTGGKRNVRRIATDDSTVFRPLKATDLSSKEDRKCMICLTDFLDEDDPEAEAEDLVILQSCVGHGFHRECIGQWIQLKNHCPYCRKLIDPSKRESESTAFAGGSRTEDRSEADSASPPPTESSSVGTSSSRPSGVSSLIRSIFGSPSSPT